MVPEFLYSGFLKQLQSPKKECSSSCMTDEEEEDGQKDA